MKSSKLVVGIGEILWDVFDTHKTLGGAPANFAYHAARAGAEGLAISAIGRDALGDAAVALLEEKQLPALLQRNEQDTGTVRISLDSGGSARYVFPPNVAWDNLAFTDELRQVAASCDAAAFGTLAQRSEASRTAIRAFLNAMPPEALRVFDVNLRQHFYDKEIIAESLRLCNVLKINDEELVVVKDMFRYEGGSYREVCLKIISEWNLKYLILTCGTNGSYIFTENESSFMETPVVNVADTVGAGDSFISAFMASILKGQDIRTAHKLAVKISAYICTRYGAMLDLPKEMTL